jgi:hypothetical protein
LFATSQETVASDRCSARVHAVAIRSSNPVACKAFTLEKTAIKAAAIPDADFSGEAFIVPPSMKRRA